MALSKTRDEYIEAGLRTWNKDAGAMNVMCEGPAEDAMIEILNERYDKLLKDDTDRKE